MVIVSQQVEPSATTEGSTRACNECKRKVVDKTEVEKSCEFKVDPLVTKESLKIEAMR